MIITYRRRARRHRKKHEWYVIGKGGYGGWYYIERCKFPGCTAEAHRDLGRKTPFTISPVHTNQAKIWLDK